MATNIGNETGTVHVPADLLAKAQAVADEEHRTIDELVREAVERYLSDRRWQHILAVGEERAKASGFTEDDVPGLIAEVRKERRQERSRD
jgi:hypothetical protein